MHSYCRANLAEFQEAEVNIELHSGVRYPLMKLIDMYLWEIGYDQTLRTSSL
jgi:hypothetical protein